MSYEAILLDTEQGWHKRGVGPTPIAAVTNAFRRILKMSLPESQEIQADNVGPTETLQSFLMVNVDDEYMERPKTLKEDVNDQKIIVRVDKTKENMYCPCGWVRQIF